MSLEVSNLSFSYKKGNSILKDVSFKADDSKLTAIIGPNGTGKSTLMKAVLGLVKKESGEVFVNSKNVSQMKILEKAKEFAYVPQEMYFPNITVYNAVLLGRKPFMKFGPTSEDFAIVESVLKELHLEDKALCNVNELSGGEKQKVYIARALAQQVKTMFFDEITSNLDIKNQLEIIELLRKIAREKELAIILIVHDLNLAVNYCDDYILLSNGEIASYGNMSLLTSDDINRVYNIDSKIVEIENEKVVIIKGGK